MTSTAQSIQDEPRLPTATDYRRWLYPLALIALCCALYFWLLGLTPLDDFDEAYYAEGAREMLARGDLGTPFYNGHPFLLKPILVYWLIAGAFRLFGTTEFAARSASAFFAIMTVLATYWFGCRTLGRRAGFLAGLILALNYLWIDTAREAMIDMPLAAALVPAMFFLYCAVQDSATRKRRWYLAAAALLGIALLAKGPLAAGVVLLGFIAYLLSAGRLSNTIREAPLLSGLLLVSLVAAPWYLYESIRHPDFLRVFFIQEHFGHLRGELARDEPWWGHLKNLFVGFYPWIAFVPAAFVYAFRQCAREHVLRFAAWWALVVVTAFSLAGAKLPHYLVPAYPALALLVAGWFDAWIGCRARGRALVGAGYAILIGVGVVLAFGAVLSAWMPPRAAHLLAARYGDWTPGYAPSVMLGALAVGSLAALLAAARNRRRLTPLFLAGGVFVAGIAHVGWFKPRLAQIQAQPRKELAQFVSVAVPASEPLGVYYAKRNATIFYARRPIVDLGEWEIDPLLEFLSSPSPAIALTHSKFLPEIEEAVPSARVWTRRGEWVLVANHPLDRHLAPDSGGE